jgi:hypothetical protein
VNPSSIETALMTGKHTPEYRHGTLFRLRVRASFPGCGTYNSPLFENWLDGLGVSAA